MKIYEANHQCYRLCIVSMGHPEGDVVQYIHVCPTRVVEASWVYQSDGVPVTTEAVDCNALRMRM